MTSVNGTRRGFPSATIQPLPYLFRQLRSHHRPHAARVRQPLMASFPVIRGKELWDRQIEAGRRSKPSDPFGLGKLVLLTTSLVALRCFTFFASRVTRSNRAHATLFSAAARSFDSVLQAGIYLDAQPGRLAQRGVQPCQMFSKCRGIYVRLILAKC